MDSPEADDFQAMEEWLDRAESATHLQQAQIAAIVREAINQRQHHRQWDMLEYVIMPTHIHVFCEIGDCGLKWILEDFKRWTGHQAAKVTGLRMGSQFWQREWFDHWSRSD
jgi:hypothetical protein